MFGRVDAQYFYFGGNSYAKHPCHVLNCQSQSLNNELITQRLSKFIYLYCPEEVRLELSGCQFTNWRESLSTMTLLLLNYIRGNLTFCQITCVDEGIEIVCDYHSNKVNDFYFKLVLDVLTNTNQHTFGLRIKKLFLLSAQHHPNFQAGPLIETAKRSGLMVNRIYDNKQYWVFGSGEGAQTYFESARVADLDHQKLTKTFCKDIFELVQAPTPAACVVEQILMLPESIAHVKYPCVIKPIDGGQGKGVTASIMDLDEAKVAFNLAQKHDKSSQQPILLEECISGFDHRLMYIGGEYFGCYQRKPSEVVGDGKSTIAKLISTINEKRTLSLRRSNYLKPIQIDEAVLNHLRIQKLTPNSVLPIGTTVQLRSNANVSSGGYVKEVVNVHPEIKRHADNIAKSVNIWALGIDVISTDISQAGGYSFIEFNRTPGIDIVLGAGTAVEKIGSAILKGCFNQKYEIWSVSQSTLNAYQNELCRREVLYVPNIFVTKNKKSKVSVSNPQESFAQFILKAKSERPVFAAKPKYLLKYGIPIMGDMRLIVDQSSYDILKELIIKHKINYEIIC